MGQLTIACRGSFQNFLQGRSQGRLRFYAASFFFGSYPLDLRQGCIVDGQLKPDSSDCADQSPYIKPTLQELDHRTIWSLSYIANYRPTNDTNADIGADSLLLLDSGKKNETAEIFISNDAIIIEYIRTSMNKKRILLLILES